jgi:hypothetical protein
VARPSDLDLDRCVSNANGSKFQIFLWLFTDNVERLFVAAQPKEGGMPHLALTRPLCEFYLAYPPPILTKTPHS